MFIEDVIYQHLASVSLSAMNGQIYPTTPTTNTNVPFMVYRVTSTVPLVTLAGATTFNTYTVEIDIYAIDFTTVNTQLGLIRNALHCYTDQYIQGMFLQTSLTQEEEYGFHGQQIYTAHARLT